MKNSQAGPSHLTYGKPVYNRAKCANLTSESLNLSFSSWLLRPIVAGLTICAVGYYVEIPGPYRALTPEYFGLTDIGNRIFTDDPRDAPQIRSLIRKARTNVAGYLGPSEITPTTIICKTQRCADTFGIESLGLAAGYHFILIAPGGYNERTITHEFTHIDLHARISVERAIFSRYPQWFDEGVASHVAKDERLLRPVNPADADWVKTAFNYSGWKRLIDQRSASQVYGAAARLVAEIEQRAGKSGLLNLIDSVGDGADFDTEYQKIVPRHSP